MARSRSTSPTSPHNNPAYPSRPPPHPQSSLPRDRSVSPTTHSHGTNTGIQRTTFESRQSSAASRSTSRHTAGRNRSNSRGTPVISSPIRGRSIVQQLPTTGVNTSSVNAPPSIFSHSGPYYLRRTNSDNALSHNFKKSVHGSGGGSGAAGRSGSPPGGRDSSTVWTNTIATISAATRLKPAVLPPSFGEPSLPAGLEADKEEKIKEYYKECGLEFEPLDKAEVFEVVDEKLTGKEIKNFVVDFGRESAWVATDVEEAKTEALLGSWEEGRRPGEVGTRWIAIFDAHKQGDFLNKILLKYGLSTRLRATMLSPPGRGNLEIAQKVWHWSTVEYGSQFLAVGFNMLHNTVSRKILKRAREDLHDTAILQEAARLNPDATREDLSTWLKNLLRRGKSDSPSNSTILPLSNPVVVDGSNSSSSSDGSQAEKGSNKSTTTGATSASPQSIFSVLYRRMTTLGKSSTGGIDDDDDDFETVREALRRQFSSKPKRKKSKRSKRPVGSNTSPNNSNNHNNNGGGGSGSGETKDTAETDSLDDEMSLNQDYDSDDSSYSDVFECNEAEENYNDIHYNPHMLRLWIWLIMTHDGTVISIHEPIPPMKKEITNPRDIKDTISHIRRNVRVVLRCLSKAGLAKKKSGSNDVEVAMEQGAMVVRRTVGEARDLLFYYLFDDWYASWSLAVDRAHPYSKELNEIRGEDPMLDHIDKLHDIARRLAGLKRVYNSYELILNQLLENKAYFREPANKCFSILSMNRFERLKHRISQLAISEIEDCEKEANGLISLTYNRLNFRETKAVEKLSLLSVALAKVTMVFLPISIVMGYFGMEEVQGISGMYDARNFWTAAGTAFGLTLVFLWFIGGFGGNFEGIGRWGVVRRWVKRRQEAGRRRYAYGGRGVGYGYKRRE
ncbi:hypothetical protein TWF225_003123 [Orbilia oligospora]|nr:hypothetical protein TWF225_003123 [Orbilia oligospora]KAF3246603.1 hypothetical protein TWF217_009936 [Orbilia oligospora]KAF3271725.1 hypothetical protein TWF128_000275 [Orbilia oligospora]